MFEDVKRKKIALLIDGDNAQPSLIGKILTEAGKYGLVTIRRIYGDWTTVNMQGWKHTLNDNAIQPIQQFRYTVGKNATDSAMIIDAMDILHTHQVDGFCLVSSDSDYTRLATRVREIGFFVMGVGKQTTPKAFVNACNIFIYTENLVPKQQRSRKERPAPRRAENQGEPKKKEEHEDEEERPKKYDPVPLLKGAFDMAVEEGGWASLSTMGFYLRQLDPGFDPRTYGHKQLSQLIKSYSDLFEMKYQDDKGRTNVFLKLKEA
ncbi:MAG: NYN domain-containing protein [Candidatus Aminicenantales bacterium]